MLRRLEKEAVNVVQGFTGETGDVLQVKIHLPTIQRSCK